MQTSPISNSPIINEQATIGEQATATMQKIAEAKKQQKRERELKLYKKFFDLAEKEALSTINNAKIKIDNALNNNDLDSHNSYTARKRGYTKLSVKNLPDKEFPENFYPGRTFCHYFAENLLLKEFAKQQKLQITCFYDETFNRANIRAKWKHPNKLDEKLEYGCFAKEERDAFFL